MCATIPNLMLGIEFYKFFPMLASNHNDLHLYHLNSCDYKYKPLHLLHVIFFDNDYILSLFIEDVYALSNTLHCLILEITLIPLFKTCFILGPWLDLEDKSFEMMN
jgi:hypothetical protein